MQDTSQPNAVGIFHVNCEQDVKVVASLKPGATLTPEALSDHLAEALPVYMRPRYIDIRSEELPKTPTGKIQKEALRALGPDGAWDAAAQAAAKSREQCDGRSI